VDLFLAKYCRCRLRLDWCGAGEEQARNVVAVRPPSVEKTSRLRSRDPVARGVKCGPHGSMNSKMKSWTVSWLSLKTKVEPGLRGSRVMSGDWWRLHRVRGVSSVLTDKRRIPLRSAAYGPHTFSPHDSQGSCQSAEQGDYKRSIYLYTLATQTLTTIRLENN
jgi:hypothetical protein